MHIYYTSKKPEVDFRYLEDSIVNLPLLFGALAYLGILIALTVWLTKYHNYQFHSTDPKDHLDTRDEHFHNEPLNPETKDSQKTTSGK